MVDPAISCVSVAVLGSQPRDMALPRELLPERREA